MTYLLLSLTDVGLYYPQKTCFSDVTASIHAGDRIAITGQNGVGKSTLLSYLIGERSPEVGRVEIHAPFQAASIPQLIKDWPDLSGGQRFNKAFSQALSSHPDILFLDEPTNHLDHDNRQALITHLRHFHGTVVFVSHDPEMLRTCADIIWHIADGRLSVYNGGFVTMQAHQEHERDQINAEIKALRQSKKALRQAQIKEQKRASNARQKGKKNIANRKWSPLAVKAKISSGESHAAKLKSKIATKQQEVDNSIAVTKRPEILKPSFGLPAKETGGRIIASAREGKLFYGDILALSELSFDLLSQERIAITGANGSGKTTLFRALQRDPRVTATGDWHMPDISEIGYLDQHYQNLIDEKTVLDTLADHVPDWPDNKLRQHLNAFLFRKNEDVSLMVSQLSGGERARLSLALIAAKPPRLLLLDEITNNLDQETTTHISDILQNFPGTFMVISHDRHFLDTIGIDAYWQIEKGTLYET